MKPVEIEILLRDRASGGVRALGNNMAEAGAAARSAARDLQELEKRGAGLDKTMKRLVSGFAISNGKRNQNLIALFNRPSVARLF